jgi:hypothetical protein
MARKKSLPTWIPAYDALALLYPHLGDYHGIKLLLAELLKDGDLDSRVSAVWTATALR